MNVKQLIAELSKYPEDTPVVQFRDWENKKFPAHVREANYREYNSAPTVVELV